MKGDQRKIVKNSRKNAKKTVSNLLPKKLRVDHPSSTFKINFVNASTMETFSLNFESEEVPRETVVSRFRDRNIIGDLLFYTFVFLSDFPKPIPLDNFRAANNKIKSFTSSDDDFYPFLVVEGILKSFKR